MIVLDTDVVSALMRAEPEQRVVEWLDYQPRASIWITAITVMEIQLGVRMMSPGRRQAALTKSFQELVEQRIEQRVAPFDMVAAEKAAALMSSRRLRGQPVDVKDTMIAGIAEALGATLATRNVPHFADLTVAVVNPWES
ncbi:MAG TPA: type II toxin-antitoxin system VapC family toxin [Candidatus Acidoferrales bacterium]|nr:type II toxin-antitoxin system VapC family toxin [Candidatus Acidoferrales bacterium]